MEYQDWDIGKGSITLCVSRELLHISHRCRFLCRAPGAMLTTTDVTHTEDLSEPQDIHGTGYTLMTAPSACSVGPSCISGATICKITLVGWIYRDASSKYVSCRRELY